jgi:hypothetical protein
MMESGIITSTRGLNKKRRWHKTPFFKRYFVGPVGIEPTTNRKQIRYRPDMVLIIFIERYCTWVKIPREKGYAIHLGRKNPSVSMHKIAVNLPDRGVIPIRIQILDRV